MILSALPTEILHAIHIYLELEGVKSLRKVSRVFGDVGVEYLFRDSVGGRPSTGPGGAVNLVIAECSVARVGAISLHPVLSRNIKSLNLCCYVHKAQASRLDVHREIKDKISTIIYDAQHPLVESGKFLNSVKGILSRLSNLQSICIAARGSYNEIVPYSVERLLKSIRHSSSNRSEFLGPFFADESYKIVAPKLLEAVLDCLNGWSLERKHSRFSLRYISIGHTGY